MEADRVTESFNSRLKKFGRGGQKDAPLQWGDGENWLYKNASENSTLRHSWCKEEIQTTLEPHRVLWLAALGEKWSEEPQPQAAWQKKHTHIMEQIFLKSANRFSPTLISPSVGDLKTCSYSVTWNQLIHDTKWHQGHNTPCNNNNNDVELKHNIYLSNVGLCSWW